MKSSIAKLQAALAKTECDGFFSLSPPANEYFTGFNGTTSGLIVTPNEALFLCDFRYIEQANEQVKDCGIEEVSGIFPVQMGEKLKALGLRNVAFDPDAITVAQRDVVAKAFGATLIADDQLVAPLRMHKSSEEVERLLAATELAEGVLVDLLAEVKPGLSEKELAARFVYEFHRRGASGPSFPPIVLFGARSSLPHGQPSSKAVAEGDVVLLDFGCRLNGYCSDLTRTYVFGSIPGAWFEEIYELTLTAQQCALEAIRPGLRGREVDAVARDLIEEAGHGPHFGHGLGHGVGIEVHEAPRLSKESETILEPGMVVTVEPGVYLPGRGGVRIEDLVVVTKDGCTILSSIPKELRILGA